MSRPKRIQLTDTRQQWLGHRSVNLNGEVLNHNISIQNRYEKMQLSLVDRMVSEYRREVIQFLRMPQWKGEFTTDASISSQVNILFNHLDAKFRRLFKTSGSEYAKSILGDINRISRTSTQNSLKKLSGGLTISTDFITDRMMDQMKAFRYENQQLTLDLEQRFTKNIRVDVLESIRQPQPDGLRGLIATIENSFSDEDRKVRNRARNIAHDQTRRAYNNLNAGRMQAVGVNRFKWIHSKGGMHPRLYHMNVLHGNIYDLNDPPVIDEKTGEKGIPGQLIGCKCSMLPIITFDEGKPASK